MEEFNKSSQAALIGVDWGTSSFRAYIIDSTGVVVDFIDANRGILSVKDGNFESVFEELLATWLSKYPTLPIILSGMITSKSGWLEVDYVSLPARIQDLSSALTLYKTKRGRELHFATGLAVVGNKTAPDVIRGEETELIGQLIHHDSEGLFLLPGTHSKWVWIKNRHIVEFQTFMTGEIYALLKEQSILAKMMKGTKANKDAFEYGVKSRISNSNSILHQVFSVRTLPLFERMPEEDVADYLSGLLIAEEVASALNASSKISQATIIGRGDLCMRYCHALELMGISAKIVEQGMVAQGHFELARQRGLIK